MTARTPRRTAAARFRIAAPLAFAVAAALAVTGCDGQSGGSGTDESGGGKAESAPLFGELPTRIQEAGVIEVGSDIAYAPVEFMDEEGEPAGIDPDLAEAMGEQLGVEFDFRDATFDQLILGMNSGRHDIVMSAMTDTEERREGLSDDSQGGADFVNYFRAGSSILVAKGNPEGIRSLEDLCGRTVAAQRGTANEALLAEQNEKCDDEIVLFLADKDTDSVAQLRSGRADAVVTDYPVAAYHARTVGGGERFEVAGEQIDPDLYGIAVGKRDTELREALRAALEAIMKNGEYARVMKKWDVASGAVEKVTVNAGR